MKPKNTLCLLVIGAAAFATNIRTSSGQVFDYTDALNNRAVAASPRAKEAFPWLVRQSRSEEPNSKARSQSQEIRKNRALASSPRIAEQFPELARFAPTAKYAKTFSTGPAPKNRAWVASPRVREEFPWLWRVNYADQPGPFEVAPLK